MKPAMMRTFRRGLEALMCLETRVVLSQHRSSLHSLEVWACNYIGSSRMMFIKFNSLSMGFKNMRKRTAERRLGTAIDQIWLRCDPTNVYTFYIGSYE